MTLTVATLFQEPRVHDDDFSLPGAQFSVTKSPVNYPAGSKSSADAQLVLLFSVCADKMDH